MFQKNRFRHFVALVPAGLAAAVPSARAATLYWDDSGASAGTSATPTGIWGTDGFWELSLRGKT